MTKLTNGLRDTIRLKVTEYTYSEQKKKLKDQENDLALELYNNRFSESVRKLMDSLPKGFLPEDNYIYVNAGGYNLSFEFKKDSGKRFPCYERLKRENLQNVNLIQKVQAFANDSEKFRKEYQELSSKLYSFLRGITTDKQLLEQMPELKTILGQDFFHEKLPTTAVSTTAKEILCTIANVRGEPREGCCNGKVVENNEKTV